MKYILKKEYPGSPKLETIVKLKNNGGYELENSTSYFMTKDKVEDYPEFWEEVVEKDYEILSFKYDNKILQFNKDQNCFIYQPFDGRKHRDLDFLLRNLNTYKIHSVKRKDGEIFTIGDKIQTSINLTINRFIIIDNELLIDPFEIIGTVALNRITKAKQPLFTTEDGVDIFKGDLFYYVKFVQYNNTLGKPFEIVRGDHPSFEYEPQYEKYFSTKEKAEEYILLNKACLSLNDLKQFFPDTYIPFKKGESATEDVNTKQLEDLVKSKIQQSV